MTTPTTPTTKNTELTTNDLMFNLQNGLKQIASFRTQKKEISVAESNALLDMETNFYNDMNQLAELNHGLLKNGGLLSHKLGVLAELKAPYAELESSKEYKILNKFEFFTKSNIPYFFRTHLNKTTLEIVYHTFTAKNVNLIINNESLINTELKAELKTAVSEYYVTKGKKQLSEIAPRDCKTMLASFNKIASDINAQLELSAKKVFDKNLNVKKDFKISDIDMMIQHLKNMKADALKK